MAKTTELVEVAIRDLTPYANNAKQHPADQIELISRSIEEFGFVSPCLIDRAGNIIAGHGRVEAAKRLGYETVPCVYVEGLTEEQRRAYILADNRLTELGGWDMDIVEEELRALESYDFDISLTGFDLNDPEFDEGREDPEGSVDLTQTLPESKVYIYSISAFGVGSELIAMVKLPQAVADSFLKAAEERPVSEIVQSLVGGLNDL